MSHLVFDGTKHTLTYFNATNVQVSGDTGWHANNVVDSSIKNLRFLPNGTYRFLDTHTPFRHGKATDGKGIPVDSIDGAFGRFGIFRLMSFKVGGVVHSGVGVHAGRASKGGADHATHGCVRTTDSVMQALVYYIMNDPLETLIVVNNHDQHSKHPQHKADSHHASQVHA